MHKCKCVYCQNIFDRDKLPFVQISERRYAHKECADKIQSQKTQDEKDYDALADYIEKLFGVGYISAKIAKQINNCLIILFIFITLLLHSISYIHISL